ncbi:MAG: STAS domain-containing protein, partial [Sphingomonas bacterium]
MTAPIEVAGPATIRTAAAIREQLLAACCDGASDVTVDLSGVAEADLSFVQTLHAARRHLAAAGGTLRLAA